MIDKEITVPAGYLNRAAKRKLAKKMRKIKIK